MFAACDRGAMRRLRMSSVAPLLAMVIGPCSLCAQPAQAPVARAPVENAVRAASLDPRLGERIVHLPITVTRPDGTAYDTTFVLSVFKPPGDGPFPLMIANHGRPGDANKRAQFQRSRMLAGYFVRRGFAVLVPTRVGYGPSGSSVDPERRPDGAERNCDAWTNAPLTNAISAHIDATLDWAKAQSYIDRQRLVLLGGSAGAFGALVAAGQKPAGLMAVINFAGGAGGWPERRPGQPCGATDIANRLADAAKRNSIPTLWFYAENDKFWGAEFPRQWHARYTAAGGKAEFHMFPPIGPVGDDGHDLMAPGVELWRPVLDRFLDAHGFAQQPRPIIVASGYATLEDVARLPADDDAARASYRKFLASKSPRAFAVGPGAATGWSSGRPDANDRALMLCAEVIKQPCTLYAVDGGVVWK
jgi:dienelactone hydrolase